MEEEVEIPKPERRSFLDKLTEKVKDFLDERKDNPKYLLRPQPQIKPIIIKAEQGLLPVATGLAI